MSKWFEINPGPRSTCLSIKNPIKRERRYYRGWEPTFGESNDDIIVFGIQCVKGDKLRENRVFKLFSTYILVSCRPTSAQTWISNNPDFFCGLGLYFGPAPPPTNALFTFQGCIDVITYSGNTHYSGILLLVILIILQIRDVSNVS